MFAEKLKINIKNFKENAARFIKPGLLLKSLSVAVVLSMLFAMVPFEADCKEINQEIFRLHILANSDLDTDQAVKLKVRDAILAATDNIYGDSTNKTAAIANTELNLDEIEAIANAELKKSGFDYTAKAEVINMYFATRYYDDITMPAGNYDALRITLGKAQGQNWWCVMYPGLCIGAATDKQALHDGVTDSQYEIMDSDGKYEYKFKIVEAFEWFCSWF
ncbi:MAG: stage II sporulation protein R [Oscillospiraceae bacterium]|jgi:stage II sporulation protein R|nr:stage II sporulation protein R [Oscillospiraceae bacterium]